MFFYVLKNDVFRIILSRLVIKIVKIVLVNVKEGDIILKFIYFERFIRIKLFGYLLNRIGDVFLIFIKLFLLELELIVIVKINCK